MWPARAFCVARDAFWEYSNNNSTFSFFGLFTGAVLGERVNKFLQTNVETAGNDLPVTYVTIPRK